MQVNADLALDKSSLLGSIRALEPEIARSMEAMDRERMVPMSLIYEMRNLGLFRMSWPRHWGGYEADPLTQIEIFEEVSRLDGSVGWIATFGALNGFAAAKLDPTACRELFPTPDTVSAGQYAPIGRAERTKGGFKVTGHWSFGSGCRHAEIMSGGVIVFENGAPRLDANGLPETRMALFPTAQCTILLDTWDTVGLRGTGSHDYTVKDLFVPYEHTFSFFDPPKFNGPLFSFAPLFLFSHVPMPLGIARAAIDAAVALGSQKRTWPTGRYLKDDAKFQEDIAEAEAALGAARSYVFAAIGDLWEALSRERAPTARERAQFRLSLIHVTRAAKDVVSQVYDAAATSAIHCGNSLDRQLRDILTVSQHRVVQTKMYRPIGQTLLGLDSKDPFI
jgi:alkylation response protein AidB-like acyl-CoA dehydrogenase